MEEMEEVENLRLGNPATLPVLLCSADRAETVVLERIKVRGEMAEMQGKGETVYSMFGKKLSICFFKTTFLSAPMEELVVMEDEPGGRTIERVEKEGTGGLVEQVHSKDANFWILTRLIFWSGGMAGMADSVEV